MSIREEQCRKVCRILDDVLAKRPTERDALCVAVDKAFEALKQSEQQRTGKWIPVTERLPEDDTVVLVCGKSGGVYTAIHNNSKTWIRGWWKMNSKNHHCNPTAWMPLPKAYQPKGERNE